MDHCQPERIFLVKYGENFHRSTLAVLPLLRSTKCYHGVEAFDIRGILRQIGVFQVHRAFWHGLFGPSALASYVALHEDVVPASTGFQP